MREPGGERGVALAMSLLAALFAARVLALMHNNLINRDYDGSFKPDLAEMRRIQATIRGCSTCRSII